VQELDGAGNILANLLTGLGIDEYFTRSGSPGTRTLLGDALNSTLALADDTGAIQTSYTYEPFGTSAVTGQTNTNSYQYTARENDGTGLDYYRARYYSPSHQRFVSEDPIGFAGGDPNLYAYVFNSPLNDNDPSGEIAPLIAAAVACGAGAIGGVAVVSSGRKPPTWGQLAAGAGVGCAGGLTVLGAWAGTVAIAAGSTVGSVTAGGSLLGAASRAAFQAAENIGNFRVPLKHLPGSGGSWSKFAEGVNPSGAIAEALQSANARFLANGETTFRVITDLGVAVGSKGQTAVRVIVDFSGRIITAFPVHP
jgi:RHS repeat-associated protein